MTELGADVPGWDGYVLCDYYRGVGTCSFGCLGPDGPLCHEIGPPTREVLEELDRHGIPYDPWFRKYLETTTTEENND